MANGIAAGPRLRRGRLGMGCTPPPAMANAGSVSADRLNPAHSMSLKEPRCQFGIHVPEPSQTDYHADQQAQRVQRALTLIDPGDVLGHHRPRIAAEPDPTQHPLYAMVCWHLERCLTPLDGGQFFDGFRQRVLAAIDTCLDDVLEAMED